MLVLSRKANQSIMIGDDIRILVVGVDRDQVKLGIEAPRHVPVHRFEIFAEIHRDAVAVSSNLPTGREAGGSNRTAGTGEN
jgi:carbon storage regulator